MVSSFRILRDRISISLRQLDGQRPIDNDDVLMMVVVEAGQLERHVGEVFALDLQIGREETDHLVLFDAGVDFLLAYLLGELGGEPGFRFRDAEIGHRHIAFELEPANLLHASFHHCRLVAAQFVVLRVREIAEQRGDDACGCDYRDEPSKPDSPQIAPLAQAVILISRDSRWRQTGV